MCDSMRKNGKSSETTKRSEFYGRNCDLRKIGGGSERDIAEAEEELRRALEEMADEQASTLGGTMNIVWVISKAYLLGETKVIEFWDLDREGRYQSCDGRRFL